MRKTRHCESHTRHCEPKAKQSRPILDCFAALAMTRPLLAMTRPLLAMTIILLDYLTKQYAVAHLTLQEPVPITSFFNFTLIYNKGAAFGFLSAGHFTYLLAAFSLIATAIFYYWYRQAKHGLQRCAIVMIMAGALGNFIDRAFYGYVIDFFDFHLAGYHWPAFNVADSAICLGVALLLLYWVKYER